MKKKRLIINLSTITVVIVMAMILVGCTTKTLTPQGENTIGQRYPSVSGQYELNSLQSAVEMYENGVKNYALLDYAASMQSGNIKNDKSGLTATHLYLTSHRIKSGSNYYLDSYTKKVQCFLNVAIMEEVVVDDSGYRIRKADKISIDSSNNMVANRWKATETYADTSAAIAAYPNDAARLNMFIVNNDTVTNATKPVYDAKNKTYSFTLELNPNESTVDYVPVMYYNTKAQGFGANNLKFDSVKLQVVMWSNGLFKSIKSKEVYSATITGITMTLTNDLTTMHTYDREEISYQEKVQF